MLPGETILGDDIAYFHAVDGRCRAANAEAGIFGIIQNVNAKDDPAIWDVLTRPGEVIFSNILVKDGRPYWLGMGADIPADGENFSGAWHKGKRNDKDVEIPCAIVYGGRDAKAYVPCQEGFGWEHGIIAYGAALETETTFATLGKEGVPEINLMSIQDFVSIPLGKYVRNNLGFAEKLKRPPRVFGVNYFLRDAEGRFVNGMRDKHVWVKWMELRVHGEAGCRRAPTGYIPCFEDLQRLFRETLGKDYSPGDYVKQFTIRVQENIEKLDRVERFHREHVPDAPDALFRVLGEQRERLIDARRRFGDRVSPEFLDLEAAVRS
jgi:phosphoenolpyruvate carboxykinase (GTP)